MGLLIHQTAGFDVPKVREVYSIGEGYEAVAAIAPLRVGSIAINGNVQGDFNVKRTVVDFHEMKLRLTLRQLRSFQ